MRNEYIDRFISGISTGPFKALRKNGTIKDVVKQTDRNDIYQCAVYQGYLDMCRTLDYQNKHDEKIISKSLYALGQKISAYFANGIAIKNEADFDDYYYTWFLQAFKKADITVGQQQKIVNMAFKYLYCCDEIRNKNSKFFKYCHMPLDSYTLNWYKNTCSKKYKDVKWSALNLEQYQDLVKDIRNELGSENVLVSEFEIWEKEKALATIKTFLSSSNDIIKSKGVLSSEEAKKLNTIIERLGKDTEKMQKDFYFHN